MPTRCRNYILALLLFGCGRSAAVDQKASVDTYKEPKEDVGIPRTINLGGGGSGTWFGPEPKREKMWTVNWRRARLTSKGKGNFAGTMEGVTGTVFQNEKAASTFSAEDGMADKKEDVLALNGNVKVVSLAYHATMYCRQLEYRPHEMLVTATGDVRIVMENGTVNAGDTVLATPDLKQVATPEMFKR